MLRLCAEGDETGSEEAPSAIDMSLRVIARFIVMERRLTALEAAANQLKTENEQIVAAAKERKIRKKRYDKSKEHLIDLLLKNHDNQNSILNLVIDEIRVTEHELSATINRLVAKIDGMSAGFGRLDASINAMSATIYASINAIFATIDANN